MIYAVGTNMYRQHNDVLMSAKTDTHAQPILS